MKNIFDKLKAEQLLIYGFSVLILLGTILLSLPISSSSEHSIGAFNALFTATSATCVTGLIVLDTMTSFSLFGKIIILLLIQIGGLGFMMFGTIIMVVLGRRISIKNRMLIRDTINNTGLSGVIRLSLWFFILSLIIEFLGAIILSIRFIPQFGLIKGFGFSIFHSVSAFCNAGFDLMGNFASLENYSGDWIILLTISFLIICGGLGFTVIINIVSNGFKFKKLNLHSKIVIIATIILLVFGTAFVFFTDFIGENVLIENTDNRLLNSFFQSTVLRTAGFSSVNQGNLSNAGKLMSIILMFIGASPASTGGGVKTTTISILILEMINVVRGNDEINILNKKLPRELLSRALTIIIISVTVIVAGLTMISVFEKNTDKQFIDLFFEVISAFATVGLSSAGTPTLTIQSQATLIPIMFLGRVGPLTIAVALASHSKNKKNKFHYPEERIMIG